MHGMTKREFKITDEGEIRRILDTAKVLRLGIAVDNEPHIIPMNYGYTLENGELKLYLHSAVKGNKPELLKKNPNICFELDCDHVPFEGKVACQYGLSYAAISGRGRAVLVEDVEQKMEAMSILMKTQTGKDFTFNERLVSIVAVIRVDVTEYTAKHRPIPVNLR
jgi:nitroimidazol reductase NimA-like FMN-containing flavoprotein (pyridoxamine 5'-phosphate oxidase superfamily)